MEVQCETFVLDSRALPTVESLINASDPDRLEQLYREAGLDLLATNVNPLRRAAAAERTYTALSDSDYQTYAGYMSTRSTLESCTITPPDQALVVLIAARKAELFDDLLILSHPVTGESLLVGEIRSGITTRYFKIAHWGYTLTSIATIRKEQRRRNRRKPSLTLPTFDNLRRPGSQRGSVYFGIITILAGIPAWILLMPISWWLFMISQIGVMILCGAYVANRTRFGSRRRWTVGWIIAIHMVLAIIAGIVRVDTWYTTDRTKEVLVCDTESTLYGDWRIETSEGEMGLDPGFYNGVYHEESSEALAQSMVGYWVKLTIHGYSLGDGSGGPYVTEATTLRPGSCAP